MNFDAPPADVLQSLLNWGIVCGSLLLIGLAIAVLMAFVLHGRRGGSRFLGGLGQGAVDVFRMSFRRVWAITTLTVKESVRRKALHVFVVFAILFMFGGWFLSDANTREELQLGVYVSFVLKTIGWLVLPVALLLSCWGIPEDIRVRSLHTVVTKPVRRSEIVAGRILGFTLVGTAVVAVMSVVGFLWIYRQVPEDLRAHQLIARVPIYGEMSWIDRDGGNNEGINVGDVNEYRKFIEGATKARAVWKFDGLSADSLLPNPETGEKELKIENNFLSFRLHKGDIEQVLHCQLTLVNPKSNLRVSLPQFPVHEFGENIGWIPRNLSYFDEGDGAVKEVDLVSDVLDDGSLTVEARCVDAGQFLGMARPDLFVRRPDRHFASTFFKACGGIWMMMVLVIILGVTASTFVKGPVATLLTLTFILMGATGFHEFMGKKLSGELKGTGMLESGIRILKHGNPNAPTTGGLENSAVVRNFDRISDGFIWAIYRLIPDFSTFSYSAYAANGYDVPFQAQILPGLLLLVGFLIPCFLLSYFSLKLRELEAK